MRLPDDAELDWSSSERYRVDAMLEAALVGAPGTVRDGLRALVRRLAPDEVMAMTDLPDTDATLRSFTGLAEITAEITAGMTAGTAAAAR